MKPKGNFHANFSPIHKPYMNDIRTFKSLILQNFQARKNPGLIFSLHLGDEINIRKTTTIFMVTNRKFCFLSFFSLILL